MYPRALDVSPTHRAKRLALFGGRLGGWGGNRNGIAVDRGRGQRRPNLDQEHDFLAHYAFFA